MAVHELRVGPLPRFVDRQRLLGPALGDGWDVEDGGERGLFALGRLETGAAADLAARLRKLVLDGRAVGCDVEPGLRRPAVRRARTAEARRRRETTPGFERAGARLDEEGRYSLTPERLALGLGARAGGRRVVDACCGAGGNAIGFAREGCAVTAIELDADRLALARHNARVYGVADRIRFVHGDARGHVAALADRDALLFVDPPWGRDWAERDCGLEELPLLAQLLGEAPGYWQLWAKLPPAFAADTLAGARFEAVFGEAPGDRRRIKFVLALS